MVRYAVTFGETAVLHIGGKELEGEDRGGYSVPELQEYAIQLRSKGINTELVILNDAIPDEARDERQQQAAVLILRGTLPHANELLKEQEQIQYDTAYWDPKKNNGKGKTLNKRARYNVVFGDTGQLHSEDYSVPTHIAFQTVPLLNDIRNCLPQWFGKKARGLNAEGNMYFHEKSGIGLHGDKERSIVICVSLGDSSTLRYYWRRPKRETNNTVVNEFPTDIRIDAGDIYVMSKHAVGRNWRCTSQWRLVHGAGHKKYTEPQKKE